MKVFIVVPAYNEEKTIASVLEELTLLYSNIIVVVDGANDQTASIAASFHGITLIEHALNRGQGAALESGTKYALKAGGDIIVHFDADGQHDAAQIARMIEPLCKSECYVTMGSRFLGVNTTPFFRKLLLKIAIYFQWLVTGLFLTDAHNGFRALNRRAGLGITITQDRMAHNTEILFEIKRLGLTYLEVPVTITYTEASQSRKHAQKGFRGSLTIVKDLVKGRFVGN